MGKPWPRHAEALRSSTISKKGGSDSRGVTKRRAQRRQRDDKADGIAKRVVSDKQLSTTPTPRRPEPFKYSPIKTKELKKARKQGFNRHPKDHGQLVHEHRRYFFPQAADCQIIMDAHQGIHCGRKAAVAS